MDLSTRTESFQGTNYKWLATQEGTDRARSITLDTSAFTAGTHYPNGYFISGIPLGKITATGLYGPYDNAASDGREVCQGFLLEDVKAPAATTTDVQGPLYWYGAVVEANLPIAVDATGKTDLAGLVKFF